MIVLRNEYPTARKEHVCNFCLNKIKKGEQYKSQTNVFDGDIYTWKSHIDCSELADVLYMYYECDEGVTDQDFREFVQLAYFKLDGCMAGLTFDEQLEAVKKEYLTKDRKQ